MLCMTVCCKSGSFILTFSFLFKNGYKNTFICEKCKNVYETSTRDYFSELKEPLPTNKYLRPNTLKSKGGNSPRV